MKYYGTLNEKLYVCSNESTYTYEEVPVDFDWFSLKNVFKPYLIFHFKPSLFITVSISHYQCLLS